ncbi:MAG: site-specific integrase [Terriglobales bacterium]|jgi:site-specific recombinase XerD
MTPEIPKSPSNTPSQALTTSRHDAYLASLLTQAEASFRASRAPSTVRAYEHDWKMFRLWCEQHGFVALPASSQAVIFYATDLAKNVRRRLGTLRRRLAAISQLHQQMGFVSPTASWEMKKFLAGLRRELGVAPERKRPLVAGDLKQILGQMPDTLLGKRDRAILLLGFSGALRRSELVALNVEDCAETAEGLTLQLRRSKTDQEGEGRAVGIPQGEERASCPLWALEQWRAAAKIESGALFRVMNRHGQVLNRRLSGEAVGMVVKRYVGWLGYDVEDFAGHSLRAGLATSAAAAGKSERAIMNQTGHRSLPTLRRYIRDGNLFRDNAADGLGL